MSTLCYCVILLLLYRHKTVGLASYLPHRVLLCKSHIWSFNAFFSQAFKALRKNGGPLLSWREGSDRNIMLAQDNLAVVELSYYFLRLYAGSWSQIVLWIRAAYDQAPRGIHTAEQQTNQTNRVAFQKTLDSSRSFKPNTQHQHSSFVHAPAPKPAFDDSYLMN